MSCKMSLTCAAQIWPCSNDLEPRPATCLEDNDNFSGLKIDLLSFCCLSYP